MNSFQKLVLSLALLQFVINVSESSSCPRQCLHMGVVNITACKCDCYPAYSGIYCERAINNCTTDQPPVCGTVFLPNMCIFDRIATYCPEMCDEPVCECGLDSCLNDGHFNQVTCSCECPSNFYGSICQNFTACPYILSCENGEFNATTCNCDCEPEYIGLRCEALIPITTTTDSITSTAITSTITTGTNNTNTTVQTTTLLGTTTTTTLIATTANNITITTSTPTTHTITAISTTTTPTTTISSTTTVVTTSNAGITVSLTIPTVSSGSSTTSSPVTSCQPENCSNGFTFNLASCKCMCGTGFTGRKCEFYDCHTLPVPDSFTLCPLLACGNPATDGACPFKCLCGGTSPAPTTTVLTTGVNSCQPLNCANGFLFNSSTCKCMCGSGFSGISCETYNCMTFPVPDSSQLCPLLTCGDMNTNGICPFKCLCGGIPRAL